MTQRALRRCTLYRWGPAGSGLSEAGALRLRALGVGTQVAETGSACVWTWSPGQGAPGSRAHLAHLVGTEPLAGPGELPGLHPPESWMTPGSSHGRIKDNL